MTKSANKVPTFDTIMWPVLQALQSEGGSATNQELLDHVMKLVKVPDDIQGILHRATRKLHPGRIWS